VKYVPSKMTHKSFQDSFHLRGCMVTSNKYK